MVGWHAPEEGGGFEDVCGGEQHAGFYSRNGEGFQQERGLIDDHIDGHGVNGADDVRCFRDHTGDSGESVDGEVLESFEVGLQAGSARAVGSGDGEGDGGGS